MKRYLARLLPVIALAACSDANSNAPTQLNLDRPVDVAFACYGGLRITNGDPATLDQDVVSSAQPIKSCDIRSGARDSSGSAPRPIGQEDMTGKVVGSAGYKAFILQSGPGTVAVAEWETKPPTTLTAGDLTMRDADPLTPGKNSIAVGEDPIAIVTDRSGCHEVIANAGSCDLSALDINSVFDTSSPGADPIVNRMSVHKPDGTVVKARPASMVIDASSETIGKACPEAPSGLVYIAYPTCHIVAGVDLANAQGPTIVTAIGFDAATGIAAPIADLTTINCPADCEGAGAASTGVRPVALELVQEDRMQRKLLAIGADNSNVVNFFDLDFNYLPFTPSHVTLENTNGHLGVTDLAISELIGMGGSTGMLNDDLATAGNHQFAYAVANDGTVHVADITAGPRECDTQVDPRYIQMLRDVDKLSCFTVGDAATPPRRPGARGPGIELVGDMVPTSVETFRIAENPADTRDQGTPDKLVGYFGMISATNGQTFVFNIDDDDFPDAVDPQNPIGTQIPLTIPHQLRDNIAQRNLLAEENGKFVCDNPGPDPDTSGGNVGGARLAGVINASIPNNTVSPPKVGGLPSIRQVFCDAEDPAKEDKPVSELSFSAPLDVRGAVFPDLRGLRSDETWTLTWEGSLSQDSSSTAVDGPAVREAQMFADGAGLRMVDQSHPYCDAGVEPYDVLQLRGCDPSLGDAGCPIGYTCYVHPQSQVTGLGACMLTDEAERLANACKDFLTSLRRYTIGRTTSGELQLLPRKHVLETTPVTGCTTDDQCQSLATYAASNASSSNPVDDTTSADPHSWQCHLDGDRKPELDGGGQPLKRCIQTCDKTEDCFSGMVCMPNPDAGSKAGYCMEGVVPPQSCINAPQRYELRAGEAFALIGTRSGFLHPNIADVNGKCVRDPNANPFLVGRIPLRAAACDPTADPLTGRRPDGTFEPNPCQTTVQESEYQLNYVEGTCTLGEPDETIVTRDATAVRLHSRGLTLTLVDPTYQGDLRCNGDRAGSLVDVPIVNPGYQLSFRQTVGFTAKTITGISPSFPVKVTRGPGESIWIVDEGDFLSTSITQASTRGKVYRVESQVLSVVNLLE